MVISFSPSIKKYILGKRLYAFIEEVKRTPINFVTFVWTFDSYIDGEIGEISDQQIQFVVPLEKLMKKQIIETIFWTIISYNFMIQNTQL